MRQRVLIVDDEPDIRELLDITLGRMKLLTECAGSVAEAKVFLREEDFDLCLTDMRLPDGNGLDLIQFISQNHPKTPVIMITAYGSVEIAVDALKTGAFDYLSKPVDLGRLRDLVTSALRLNSDASKISEAPRLLGDSLVMVQLRDQVSKLARSQAPVYIHGESGSGKELVAQSIHDEGPRKSAPFIAVNCGAIPNELMESEFFGHKKGSFTGANEDKIGLFQSAHGGTLFLDEVADLPLHMQVKLLRVIQQKAVRPVGAAQELSVDTRILSATHKDLTEEVAQGRFRQDLFYRLNVIELKVPALRVRLSDIPLLVKSLLTKLQGNTSVALPSVEALNLLMQYHFPGNVRELENLLERAVAMCDGHSIEVNDIALPQAGHAHNIDTANPLFNAVPPVDFPDRTSQNTGGSVDKLGFKHQSNPTSAMPAFNQTSAKRFNHPEVNDLEGYLEDIERQLILQTLESVRWNRTLAAEKLGLSFRSIRYRLKKLGIE